MKKLLASVALLASAVGVAHADPAFTNSNATIGAQVNQQYGAYNVADNSAAIRQDSAAFASPGLPWLAPTGSASTNSTATIGAQMNNQVGYYNRASNSAAIDQSSVAASPGFYLPGGPSATNANATIGAQVNSQYGVGNVASNSAYIGQRSEAVSETPLLLPMIVD